MKTTAEILREARALIDTPEKWTKDADARDRRGEEMDDVADAESVCWCAGGAIARVVGDENPSRSAYEVLAAAMGVRYPFQFNDRDETTHADVLAAFDRAIEAEEATR